MEEDEGRLSIGGSGEKEKWGATEDDGNMIRIVHYACVDDGFFCKGSGG